MSHVDIIIYVNNKSICLPNFQTCDFVTKC